MVRLTTELVVVILVGRLFATTFAGPNVSLVSFPINITSVKHSLVDAFNDPFPHLRETLADYAKKENNLCVEEGGECTAKTSSCCIVPDYDLECLPSSETDIHICRVKNSEELAQARIDGLQYGDSKGIMNSHDWAESWEFQSKSELEREEEQAEEDFKWRKNLNLSASEENAWTKTYKRIKNGGENIWHDLKKLNKLREIKNNLIDKYLKRDQSNELAVTSEEVTATENTMELHVETTPKIEKAKEDEAKPIGDTETFSDYSWFYKDARPSHTNNESDESFIKFSNEIPKQDNNINFRIDDIIRDVTKVLSNKLKKKPDPKKTIENQGVYFPLSSQEILKNDVLDSEERLRKEINELQGQHSKPKKPSKSSQLDSDERIHKHVSAILEEERKLDKLNKLKEINRLEQRA